MASNKFVKVVSKIRIVRKIKIDRILDKMPIRKRVFISFTTILIISNFASILGLMFLEKLIVIIKMH